MKAKYHLFRISKSTLFNIQSILFYLVVCDIPDPAKRMNGAYGYIGYLGVIILSISIALQLLGVF